MQNGAFGWASSLSSSLAAQKAVSWSTGVGYQASLTDLFLKKNSLPFGSGISQLAAASSYLEKMSSASDSHQSDLTHAHHPQQQQLLTPAHSRNKCSHVGDKSHKNQASFACDVCPAEFHPTPGPSNHKSATHHSFPDHSHHPPTDKSPMHQQHGSPSAPTSSPHHHSHHMPPPSGPSATQPSAGAAGTQNSTAGPSGSSCSRRSSNSANRSKNAPVKQFLCPVCHRTFTQKGNLKTHMMIHSGDKPYSCQICGKSFTQKGNVDTHMKIHTGEKDYNCRHCSKGFTQRGNLKTHERSVHTKEKPYACEICGKSFSQKGNMMTHLRTHNKDDRFPCTLCGKTFSQKGNLKTHMQRHSGTLPARRYGPRSRQNRVNAAAAATRSSGSQFSATATESRASTAQKGSSAVDEESLSSVDHSLDSGSGVVHSQSSHNLLSPPVVAEAAHSALKHVTQSRDHHHHQQQQLQHQLPLPEQRNNPIAPIAMQFNSRFYSPSSSLSAPLAHTATWLASGAASAVAGITGSKGRQYDSFLSSYAGFGQHHHHPGQHLTRLTLLPPATHAMDHHHHHGHHHHGEDKNRDGVQMHQQAEYGTQQPQPNPDFSQLLD